MNARLIRPSLLVAAVAAALAGCGGSGHHNDNDNGGGSSDLKITSQPSSTKAGVGGTATFTVSASGANAHYQWYRNSTAIAGATAATYTTGTLTDVDDGASFYVIVTNDSGSVKSDTVTLELGAAGTPSITGQPASVTAPLSGSASFTVVATGNALTYQWYKDGAKISGATNATYTVSSISASSAGTYYVIVANAQGSVQSGDATLTIGAATAPAITTQPTSQTVGVGGKATFSVVASGSGPLTYQWYKDGTAISGATGSTYSFTTDATSGGSYKVVVTNAAGSATSNAVTLTVLSAPSITQQPTAQTAFSGQTVTLTVAASGGNLSYQWYKEGAAISGATSATYSFTASVNPSNAGNYKVTVTNIKASVTSNTAAVTVYGPPTITTQPSNVTAGEGGIATFTVGATGNSLAFQWYKNGSAISGATSTSYTTPALLTTDTGATFYCVVTNGAGSVSSNTATLTVQPKPIITTQPVNKTVTAPATATFSVVANSPNSGTLTYQWYRGGTAISGATGSSYTTPATDSSFNGAQYYVIVYNNTVASVQSSTVVLTVN